MMNQDEGPARPSTPIRASRDALSGAPLGRQPMVSIPGVVAALAGVMIAVFVVQVIAPSAVAVAIDRWLGFIPLLFTARIANGDNPFLALLPLFGHQFLHGGPIHLLTNLMWLTVFGAGVARRLGVETGPPDVRAYRTSLFLAFFLLCGVLGAVGYYALHQQSAVTLVGASGAISGLMAGALRFIARGAAFEGGLAGGASRLNGLTARPVVAASLAYLLINLAVGAGIGAPEGVSVAWEAHIFGFIAGLVAFPAFDRLAAQRGRAR